MSDLRVCVSNSISRIADFRLQVLDLRFRIPDNRIQIARQFAQPASTRVLKNPMLPSYYCLSSLTHTPATEEEHPKHPPTRQASAYSPAHIPNRPKLTEPTEPLYANSRSNMNLFALASCVHRASAAFMGWCHAASS